MLFYCTKTRGRWWITKYTDNPRKVYGLVEIIYSDAEISKDIVTAVSDSSEISHPIEVYQGFMTPTVKACTMDGNSKMDSCYQMLDDTCVLGWWSKSLCDGSGSFAEPKPYIELSFVQRPIISWIIIGDDKLNQFPVDFDVTYYNGDKIIRTDKIQNNTKLQVKIEPRVEDIIRIRLTVLKWNTPNACAKILQFYDRLYERYEGDAVQMFEVNEEMGSAEGNYNINSDTMTVSLYNLNRKFDKGYLRSLMILDRKIIPSLGIENDGKIAYQQLGVFYSDEWQISQDSQWVKCSAVDKLLRLQSKTYVGFPLRQNVSLKEIAEDIFVKLGLNPTEYDVSEDLNEFIIPNAYLAKMTVWDALQEIANAGLCRAYIDRTDRIIVSGDSKEQPPNAVEIGGGNMFSSTSNITLTEFANQIEVEYSEVTLSEDIVDTAETEVTLGGGESMQMSLDYTSDIANAFAESNNANIRISNFRSGVNAGEFTVTNISDSYQTAKLKITGNAIVINSRTITKKDENSIRNFGVTEYKHPVSELVQSHEHAEYIATVLLAKMHAGEGVVTAVWRGNPDLELGQEFDFVDRFKGSSKLVCEYNKFTYDGALRQETRGRKV